MPRPAIPPTRETDSKRTAYLTLSPPTHTGGPSRHPEAYIHNLNTKWMVPGSCTRASLVILGPNTPRETTTLATLVFVPCCTPTQSLTAVTSRRWLAHFSISQGSLNQQLYQVLQLFPKDQLRSRRARLRVSLPCCHCTINHQLGAYTNEKH